MIFVSETKSIIIKKAIMKTSLQNFKKRVLAATVAIAAFTGLNAQCVTSTTITNQGSGNISYTNQSSYSGGWDSYTYLSYGDGNTGFGTGTSFTGTHQYTSNGIYLVVSEIFAYDPADSSVNCSYTDYDTVVVSDIACSVVIGTINYYGTGGFTYDFSVLVNSSQASFSGDWVITDSLGNYIHSQSGTGLDSITFTFPGDGFYNIGFSAYSYDSLTSTYCADSVYTMIGVGDTTGPGACNLQVNIFTNDLGSNVAYIQGNANNYFTNSYMMVDGQYFWNTDSMTYTFPAAGSYNVCYYVEDSTASTYCYDSTCIVYTTNGSTLQCNANFYLWEDSTNVGQWYAINYASGTGALTYTWDFGDGTTSNLAYPSHTYAVPGNYVICLTITDANGCTSSSCDSSAAFRISQQQSTNSIIGSLTVSAPVGVKENLSVLAETKVSPNPMTETSAVTFNSSLSANGKIEIVNILGAVVLSENVTIAKGNNEFKLNTSSLNNGVYYVNIITEGRVLSVIKAIK